MRFEYYMTDGRWREITNSTNKATYVIRIDPQNLCEICQIIPLVGHQHLVAAEVTIIIAKQTKIYKFSFF